jgi:hypothetical protein
VLNAMVKNNYLRPVDWDEEMGFLSKYALLAGKSEYFTPDCRCFYPEGEKNWAERFTRLIQELYLTAPRRFQKLMSKLIIFLGKNRQEISPFWNVPVTPDWLKGFVSVSRILVMDIEQLKQIDFQSSGFQDSMRHEIMHILLHEQNLNLPVWLEEGTCDYFSKPVRTQHLLSLARKKPIRSFNEIEKQVNFTLLDIDGDRAINNICYQQSHNFVAYLCRKHGEDRYIDCIQKTGLRYSIHDVFPKTFGSTLEMEETLWRTALKC